MASNRICKVEGCGKKHQGLGYCSMHYSRLARQGDILAGRHKSNPICKVEGCGKKYHAHGYCAANASKFLRHGDPLAGRHKAKNGALLQWIKDHANYAGDDCLKWPFEITKYGYGTIKFENKKRVASRVMCIVAHGRPPKKGMEAAHSCGNGHKACVNPRHLRWRTRLQNSQETVAMGRSNRGEKSPSHKLTENDVKDIRKLSETMLQKEIAKIYGVRPPAISRVLGRKRWAWLD